MQSSGHLLSNHSNSNAINSTHNNQNLISLSNANSINSNQIENGFPQILQGNLSIFPFSKLHQFITRIPRTHFSQPAQWNFLVDYQNSLMVHSQTVRMDRFLLQILVKTIDHMKLKRCFKVKAWETSSACRFEEGLILLF